MHNIPKEFTYTPENQLERIESQGSTLARYEYDDEGLRTKKVVNSQITVFISGLYERKGNSSTAYIYLDDGSTIASLKGSDELEYYYSDHLGGINVVVNDTGAIADIAEYSPFGEFSRHDAAAKRTEEGRYYTNQYRDNESGLYYYGGRYYNPKLSRFITPDPFVSDPSDPQSFNRFSYVGNNPINYIDPSGFEGIELEKIVLHPRGFEKAKVEVYVNTTSNEWSRYFLHLQNDWYPNGPPETSFYSMRQEMNQSILADSFVSDFNTGPTVIQNLTNNTQTIIQGVTNSAVAQANSNVNLTGSLQNITRSFALTKISDIKVKVPYAGKGVIFGGKVFMGGPKGIATRAANALGVGAKFVSKTLGVANVIKYTGSAWTAATKGDWLTATHDIGMLGISAIGLAGQKYITIAGEAVDTASKLYGSYSTQ